MQPCDFTLDAQKGDRFGRQDTVHQSFHQALDATERCPQLVRQVADSLQPAPLYALQGLACVVGGSRQDAQFVLAWRPDAVAIVAPGDALAGLHYCLDRAANAPGRKDAEGYGHQESRRTPDDQQLVDGVLETSAQRGHEGWIMAPRRR